MKLSELFALFSESPNQINKLMIERLRTQGYVVELSGPWETVGHICKRLHISPSKFRRRMKRRHPNPSDVETGATGRLISLRSNLQLDRFLVGTNGEIRVPKKANASITIRIGRPARRKRAKKR